MNQDLFKQKRKKTLRSQQKHEIITFILKKTNNHVSLRKNAIYPIHPLYSPYNVEPIYSTLLICFCNIALTQLIQTLKNLI